VSGHSRRGLGGLLILPPGNRGYEDEKNSWQDD
jgi:hypothetical protein